MVKCSLQMLLIYPVLRPQPVTHWLLTQPVRIFMQRKAKKRMAEICLQAENQPGGVQGKKSSSVCLVWETPQQTIIWQIEPSTALAQLGKVVSEIQVLNQDYSLPRQGTPNQSQFWRLLQQTCQLVINSQFSLPLSIYHRCMDKAHTAQKWHSQYIVQISASSQNLSLKAFKKRWQMAKRSL